jgi:hypothetical protein
MQSFDSRSPVDTPKIPYKKNNKIFDLETIEKFKLSEKEFTTPHKYNHIA